MRLEMEKNGQQQIASSLPPSRSSPIAMSDEVGANQKAALCEEHNPEPNADADVDKGGWPGEYAYAYAHDEHITVSGIVPISAEELERAIGAAFAVGMQY